jgi:hypothetical protein
MKFGPAMHRATVVNSTSHRPVGQPRVPHRTNTATSVSSADGACQPLARRSTSRRMPAQAGGESRGLPIPPPGPSAPTAAGPSRTVCAPVRDDRHGAPFAGPAASVPPSDHRGPRENTSDPLPCQVLPATWRLPEDHPSTTPSPQPTLTEQEPGRPRIHRTFPARWTFPPASSDSPAPALLFKASAHAATLKLRTLSNS